MPELGKYAVQVLSAYGVSIVLVLGLVAASLYRARQVRNALRRVEGRQEGRHG